MGNACIYGGADVTGECISNSATVETAVKDNGDGSYYLHWNSNRSGTFNVAIKIYREHIVGSPTSFKLTSTTPDLSKSEVYGKGLNVAVAGIPNSFRIKFFDQHSNAALPASTSNFGLALLKSGEKNKEAKAHDHTMSCVNPDDGEYEVLFTATKDGTFDLHVWSEDPDPRAAKNERFPFPGSPFHCVVSPGAASPQMSFVDGWMKESRAVDKHGKAVQQETNSVKLPAGCLLSRSFRSTIHTSHAHAQPRQCTTLHAHTHTCTCTRTRTRICTRTCTYTSCPCTWVNLW